MLCIRFLYVYEVGGHVPIDYQVQYLICAYLVVRIEGIG